MSKQEKATTGSLRERRINHISFLIKETWLIRDDQKDFLLKNLKYFSDKKINDLLLLLSDAYVKQSFFIQETLEAHPELIKESHEEIRKAYALYLTEKERSNQEEEAIELLALEQEIENLFNDDLS
jgi:hypothetical protein